MTDDAKADQMKHEAPHPSKKSFTCPHCGVYARQFKWGYTLQEPTNFYFSETALHDERAALVLARCEHCHETTVWVSGAQVAPNTGSAPLPNPDMPENVRLDYEEAAKIYTQSPRGAAALLRLAVQKLMVHLGEPGKRIDDDIKSLVQKGLNGIIQQALDIVRVTGNNAVHPGMLEADDANVAQQLFPLINLIVESQISMPARVQEMYGQLPKGALAAIAKRDGQQ